MAEKRELWTGRFGFVLSAMGSAIGLGSIWKFPYEVGANGGAGFIVLYILGLAVVVFPLMLLEFAIGRRGRSDGIGSLAAVASESGGSACWQLVGALGTLTSFLILSFYSVIGGWALYYVVATLQAGLPAATADAVQARFAAMLASPRLMTAYHVAFMTVTALIVARGIADGIERACKILMPALLILVVVLALYSMSEGDVGSALKFLFRIDPRSISATVALEALGLGFFSIGVGLAVMIAYGSYADRKIDLRSAAIATMAGDTLVSFLAGLAVFPIVFAEHLDPASGPRLMFVTLPLAFSRLPFGTAAAVIFFVLLTIAALASAVSLLELPAAFVRRWLRCSRFRATAITAASCGILGLLSVFSFNILSNWHPLAAVGLPNATVFDLLDDLTSNILLPVAGFGLALFGGWIMLPAVLAAELHLTRIGLSLLQLLLRYIVPLSVAAAALAAVRF